MENHIVAQRDPGFNALRNRECWLFAVLTFVMLLPGLDRGFSLDEYKTKMVAQLGWGELIHDRLSSGHLPTYFGFIKIWTEIFGDSAVTLRLPSVFLVVVATPFVYLFTRRIAGIKAARWAAIVFSLNQGVVWIGQTGRPYGGILLSGMILFWAAANWWALSRKIWLAVVFAAALLGIAFMPLAGVTSLALALGLLPFCRKHFSKVWPLVASVLCAVGIGLIPTIILSFTQTKLGTGGHYYQFPDLLKLQEALFNMVYGSYDLWARGIMQYVSDAAMIGAIWLVYFHSRNKVGNDQSVVPWRTWLLFWIFAPLLTLVVASSITSRAMVSHQRYRVVALGGVIVLLALGLDRLQSLRWNRWIKQSLSVLCLLPMILTTVAWWRVPGEGVRPVVSEVLRLDSGIPKQVAGHGRWFRLELPEDKAPVRELFLERGGDDRNEALIEAAQKSGHDVQVMQYDKDSNDVKGIRQKLSSWAAGDPFWLFVYIQRKDALDLIAKHPPAGYRLVKTVRDRDARAYRFVAE